MAIGSILLAVLAFIATVVGFLLTPIPVLGAVVSFGAAALALGGIMLGGRAVSRAKRSGVPNDVARIAVVVNVLAFVPALLVALTCGVCNALVSTGNMQLQKNLNFKLDPGFGPGATRDAGAEPPPSPQAPPGNGAPSSDLPPPPLPPGPRK
jgi:hypothetical protein